MLFDLRDKGSIIEYKDKNKNALYILEWRVEVEHKIIIIENAIIPSKYIKERGI